MTDKRFTLSSFLDFDIAILDDGEEIGSLKSICELLNKLNEENKKLKQRIKQFENYKEDGDVE